MTGPGADPAAPPPGPPALDRPLGSLDFRLRRTIDDGFEVSGRRASVTGTGAGGIEAVWTHPVRVVRGLGVVGATAREAMETPLGVERRLALDGAALVERVVVSRDAPVAWVEWVAAGGDEPGTRTLALEWRVPLDGPPILERDGRRLTVRRPGSGFRAVFILGAEPESVESEPVEIESVESEPVEPRPSADAGVDAAGGAAHRLGAAQSDLPSQGTLCRSDHRSPGACQPALGLDHPRYL